MNEMMLHFAYLSFLCIIYIERKTKRHVFVYYKKKFTDPCIFLIHNQKDKSAFTRFSMSTNFFSPVITKKITYS